MLTVIGQVMGNGVFCHFLIRPDRGGDATFTMEEVKVPLRHSSVAIEES